MCFDWGIVNADPSEVIFISGPCHGDLPTILSGGWALVIPGFHQICRLSLNTMTCIIQSDGVYTEQGVPISVTGVAQVRFDPLFTLPSFVGDYAPLSSVTTWRCVPNMCRTM